MIDIKSFEFNAFAENTYVLSDESGECIIIDPGCYEKIEQDTLTNYISDQSLTVSQLINTHCHIDHVFGNSFVKEHYQVDLVIHPEDEATLNSVEMYAPLYGFDKYEKSSPDKFINEGDVVSFGHSNLEVLFVPGHAPGHIVLVNKEQNFCIGGDVLFRESIGRTDLPGGDHQTLLNNIQSKMFALNEEMTVYPGHGPTTTIGYEKRHNPFCALPTNS